MEVEKLLRVRNLAMPRSSQERGIKGMGCEKLFCDNRVELIRD